MCPHTDAVSNLRRRDFLRLASGVVALSASSIIEACGGGGNNGSSMGPSSRIVTGLINTSQIGGANLAVVTAFQAKSAVSAQGQFSTPVSSLGSQLLAVTDGAGKLRGLSVSVPNGPAKVTCDASSTGLTLVLITPGILAVDSPTTSLRLQQIGSLASFAPLSTYLEQNLPSKSLNDLQQDPGLDQLKSNCIDDWMAQFSGRSAHTPARRGAGQPAFTAQFTTPPTVAANLTNSGWRFLSIVREDLDADGDHIRFDHLNFKNGFPAQAFGLFDGVASIGWGSIFSRTVGAPVGDSNNSASVPASLTDVPDIASVKYWLYGPGNFTLNNLEDEPDDLEANFKETAAWGASFVYYVLFPLIDAGLGLAGSVLKDAKSGLWQSAFAAQAVWASGFGSYNLASLIQAAQSGNLAAVVAALLDLFAILAGAVATILEALIEVGVLVLAEGVALAAAVTIVGEFLLAMSIAFTAANLGIIAATWLGYPTIASIELPVSSAGVTVQ